MGSVFYLCIFGLQLNTVFSIENIALNKPTWQKYPFPSSYYGADRAVDGKKSNLSFSGGQCVLSANFKDTAEWRVDLENIFVIHYIIIHYRTDGFAWDESNELTGYLLGFSLFISNTTNKEDGTMCFRDQNYTRATIPNPVILICPIDGKYVIFYNNRTSPPYPNGYSKYAGNYLCEVEVVGSPIQERYGERNSTLHPLNCSDVSCTDERTARNSIQLD